MEVWGSFTKKWTGVKINEYFFLSWFYVSESIQKKKYLEYQHLRKKCVKKCYAEENFQNGNSTQIY